MHRPRSIRDKTRLNSFRWFDCAGRELGDDFKTKRLFSDYGRPNARLAQLNHYPLGAMESYVLKADRGRVNRQADLGMDYWVERNYSAGSDNSIARYSADKDTQLAVLMDDSRLAALHKNAVAWRRSRFRELMLQEPNRALFTRLLMTPPSRPVDAAAGEALRGFAMAGLAAEKDRDQGN